MIISFREKYLLAKTASERGPNAYPWNSSFQSKVDKDGKRQGDDYIPDGLKVNRIKINEKLLKVDQQDKKFLNWETINQIGLAGDTGDAPISGRGTADVGQS